MMEIQRTKRTAAFVHMRWMLIVLMTTLCLSQSQAQVDFLPIGAKHYHLWSYLIGNEIGNYRVASSEVVGEELFMGELCKVVRVGSIDHTSCWRFGTIYLYKEADEVYLWNDISEEFQLLYDFAAMPGETYQVKPYLARNIEDSTMLDPYALRDTLVITVESISTVNINGTSIRVQHTNAGDIYENIGNTRHLLYSPATTQHCLIAEIWMDDMRCYYDPVIGEIPFHSDGGTCDEFVSSAEVEQADIEVSIFPNPTSDVVTVRTSSDDADVTRYQVFSRDGRQVIFGDWDGAASERRISFEDVAEGLYLLRVFDDEECLVLSERVVKQ